MRPAPIQEAAGNVWSGSWVQWFASLATALGGWRKTLTKSAALDFGSVAAHSQSELTATVTGAQFGDGVLVTPMDNTTGIIYHGVVTDVNTVSIYASNITAIAINPAVQSYRIIIFQN